MRADEGQIGMGARGAIGRASVVIPTHLRVDMLADAVDAVIAQTVAPLELVVVTDASDAATEAVVDAAGARTSIPIRLVANHDRPGASGSRNVGARHTTGDLLAFLDDDDLWTPEHLEDCVRTIESSGADLVVSGIEVFSDCSSAPGIQLVSGVTARQAAASVHGVTGSNVVVRAHAFWSIGGFDPGLRHLNDRDFFYRCMLAGLSYAVSPNLTARYRKHDSGQLSGASEGRARGVAAYLVKHRRTLTLRDRRTLRYQIAVMRYRATQSAVQRGRWLAWAGLNASYSHTFARLRRVATKAPLLSGRAFESDSRYR